MYQNPFDPPLSCFDISLKLPHTHTSVDAHSNNASTKPPTAAIFPRTQILCKHQNFGGKTFSKNSQDMIKGLCSITKTLATQMWYQNTLTKLINARWQ